MSYYDNLNTVLCLLIGKHCNVINKTWCLELLRPTTGNKDLHLNNSYLWDCCLISNVCA